MPFQTAKELKSNSLLLKSWFIHLFKLYNTSWLHFQLLALHRPPASSTLQLCSTQAALARELTFTGCCWWWCRCCCCWCCCCCCRCCCCGCRCCCRCCRCYCRRRCCRCYCCCCTFTVTGPSLTIWPIQGKTHNNHVEYSDNIMAVNLKKLFDI